MFLIICFLMCIQTRCDEVAEALVAQGLSAVSLHGGRSQSERESALHDFRSGSTNILVISTTELLLVHCFSYFSFPSLTKSVLYNIVS